MSKRIKIAWITVGVIVGILLISTVAESVIAIEDPVIKIMTSTLFCSGIATALVIYANYKEIKQYKKVKENKIKKEKTTIKNQKNVKSIAKKKNYRPYPKRRKNNIKTLTR